MNSKFTGLVVIPKVASKNESFTNILLIRFLSKMTRKKRSVVSEYCVEFRFKKSQEDYFKEEQKTLLNFTVNNNYRTIFSSI